MTWKDGLVLTTALVCAVTGGVYFAFSGFVMDALARQGEAGAAAMRSINEIILRSGFMPLFFAGAIAALVLVVIGAFDLDTIAGKILMAAGVLYVFGMFGTTVVVNVPLNDSLAAGTIAWPDYVRQWTSWNSARAVASILASALFAWTLVL